MHSFIIHDIRPCPAKTCRFVCAVEIKHQPVFCGSLGCPAVKSDHHLVITVHKVNLETLYAHLGIMPADFFHVTVKCPVSCPQDKPDTACGSIFHKLFQIYLRNHLKQVSLKVHGPSLIKYDVFYAMSSRKIHIIFVCPIVDACPEIHSLQIPVIPPFPGHFSRAHPAPVGSRIGRFSKKPDHVIACHVNIPLGHGNYSPRELNLPAALRDIRFTALYEHLQHIVTSLFKLTWIRGKNAVKHSRSIVIVKIHSRIICQARFGDADFLAGRAFHHKRKKCEPLTVPCGNRRMRIGILKRVIELAFKRLHMLADICCPHVPVLCKRKRSLL